MFQLTAQVIVIPPGRTSWPWVPEGIGSSKAGASCGAKEIVAALYTGMLLGASRELLSEHFGALSGIVSDCAARLLADLVTGGSLRVGGCVGESGSGGATFAAIVSATMFRTFGSFRLLYVLASNLNLVCVPGNDVELKLEALLCSRYRSGICKQNRS